MADEPQRLQNEMRARLKKNGPPPIMGQTIFPGSPPRSNSIGVSVERKVLERMRDEWWVMFPDDKGAEAGMFVGAHVYGVVAYRSAYDQAVHTTGFIIDYYVDGTKALRINIQNPAEGLPVTERLQGRISLSGWDAD